MNQVKKIGFSFSGGGARAAAHIGILKVLEEHSIRADYVTGTSGGAIVAALYAAGISIDQMQALADEGSLFKIYRPGIPIQGLTTLSYLKKLLTKYIGKETFEGLDIPLSVVTGNLITGKAEIFDKGPLYPAIMASCAIPLIFKPVEINGQPHVDGGVFDNIPIKPLQPHCDITLGFNVMPLMTMQKKQLENMYSIGMRVFEMSVSHLSEMNFPQFDHLIEAQDVVKYSIFNFGASKELYEIGYKAAQENISDVLRLLL